MDNPVGDRLGARIVPASDERNLDLWRGVGHLSSCITPYLGSRLTVFQALFAVLRLRACLDAIPDGTANTFPGIASARRERLFHRLQQGALDDLVAGDDRA